MQIKHITNLNVLIDFQCPDLNKEKYSSQYTSHIFAQNKRKIKTISSLSSIYILKMMLANYQSVNLFSFKRVKKIKLILFMMFDLLLKDLHEKGRKKSFYFSLLLKVLIIYSFIYLFIHFLIDVENRKIDRLKLMMEMQDGKDFTIENRIKYI